MWRRRLLQVNGRLIIGFFGGLLFALMLCYVFFYFLGGVFIALDDFGFHWENPPAWAVQAILMLPGVFAALASLAINKRTL
jgi:hypothetical protein